jgi:LysR family transcriptional regulator, glycine cleavage system transcriptional activator
MPRKIPPFAALRAFEAAARHCNLRLAGEELFLSVSAVSHQIKSLEQLLGVQLFIRTHTGLKLTTAGATYLKDIAGAFDTLAAATIHVSGTRDLAKISINMFPSLAVLWFMPKLSSWYERSPDTDITVITSIESVSFRSSAIDVAIRYEEKSTLSPAAVTLFDEYIYPVCSPSYAQNTGLDATTSDLEGATLIHCQSAPGEWEQWFRGAMGCLVPPRRSLNVDNRALALQAAESGLGVAMGRTPFAQRAFSEGRLRRLFDSNLPSGFTYAIALSDGATRNPTINEFTHWLTEIAKECDK